MKKSEKDEKNNHKWRTQDLKYHKPHLSFNIYHDFYPSLVVDLRTMCLNEGIEFETLDDGEKYFIVRLETSKADEDGVLTYWRAFDHYVMAVGVKNRGMYYLVEVPIFKNAKSLGGV